MMRTKIKSNIKKSIRYLYKRAGKYINDNSFSNVAINYLQLVNGA